MIVFLPTMIITTRKIIFNRGYFWHFRGFKPR